MTLVKVKVIVLHVLQYSLKSSNVMRLDYTFSRAALPGDMS